MTISRWKVMAGVLGVSLGGLAAIAGQCPKADNAKTRRAADAPLTAEAPKPVPPGGSGKPTKVEAPVADLPALPPLGGAAPADLPPPLPIPAGLPDVPPPAPKPTKVEAPALPTATKPMSKPDALPKPEVAAAPKTPDAGLIPVGDLPPAPVGKPAVSAGPPLPTPNASEYVKPVAAPAPTFAAPTPPVASALPLTPPTAGDPLTTPDPRSDKGTVVQVSATTAAKFRIVLRVGEGDPTFEVRHGDDLVMKVLCEKVDVKSPEKGQGLSAVTATGKVRFVGFGSEGTCESFSFMAGTGEVAMSGNVKVQVKDKIGRVESELTTEQMKYKLDTSAMPGVLKP